MTELKHHEHGAQIHTAIPYKGQLYANLNTNDNMRGYRPGKKRGAMPDGLACLDLDGNILWQTHDKPHFDRGGVLIADGMIIAMGGSDGVLHLLEARPDNIKVLASATVFDTGGRDEPNIWAPLALTDGKLLVRDQHQLKCLDLVNP